MDIRKLPRNILCPVFLKLIKESRPWIKLKISEVLKKYTMIIALAVIVYLFTVNTGGQDASSSERKPNLIASTCIYLYQHAVLYPDRSSIDLSVGSVVCFVGAIRQDDGKWASALPYTYRHGHHGNVSGSMAGILDCLYRDSSVYRYPGRHADVQDFPTWCFRR